MPLRQQFKVILVSLGFRPTGGVLSSGSGAREFLESSRIISTLVFAATVAAIVLISFVGVTITNLPVLPNQLSSVRIVSSASFSYESVEKTQQARNAIRDRTPPVYRLENESLRLFETHLDELLADLEKFEQNHPAGAPFVANREADFAALVETFNAKGPYRVGADDLTTLLAAGDAKTRHDLMEKGRIILRNIYADGVHDDRAFGSSNPGEITVYKVVEAGGQIARRSAQSMEDAFGYLRVNVSAEMPRPELAQAMFRLLRNGLVPDLAFDDVATKRLQNEAMQSVRPVSVSVENGQTIIEPGTRVTPEQYEMLVALRRYLSDHGDLAIERVEQLFYRILLVLAMVMASVFYIRLEDRATLHSNSRLALLALVVIINLALVRLTYGLASLPFFADDTAAASLLPYLAPTAIAPLVIAILIDAGSASFMALFISIFTSVIYGNRLDLLVLTFLGSMVAIYCSRQTRKRSTVLRASALGGLTVAVFALFLGVVDQLDPLTVLKHMATGLGTGLLTGGIVVGLLLPVLERLFKHTTDITLLELTDYNHPLLRLMQMEAPGTYHHSLIVAQLSENAAGAIGANPLLARVCALFHDIGKTARPGHFSENQQDGVNPHDGGDPAASALIIKSHVRDGVALAIRHRLPRAVTDVIQQHHGTTLIRYFYQRAVSQTRPPGPATAPPFGAAGPEPASAGSGGAPVNETHFRYDGPRPRFKESAIIHFADGVEAASRTLRTVTPQHLAELIDAIVRQRIEDGQIEEAPLTFKEISLIKQSFAFTLLNMLHGRVAYPPTTPATGRASETRS